MHFYLKSAAKKVNPVRKTVNTCQRICESSTWRQSLNLSCLINSFISGYCYFLQNYFPPLAVKRVSFLYVFCCFLVDYNTTLVLMKFRKYASEVQESNKVKLNKTRTFQSDVLFMSKFTGSDKRAPDTVPVNRI